MLVTVTSFREPFEAHLFRGRLQAEGLFAVVSHDQHISTMWSYSVLLGGAKVQVSTDEIELARAIDRACGDGTYKALLKSEIGDLDDPVCPHCGGSQYRKRRPLPRAILAIAISLLGGTILPPIGWIHRCESCRKEYRAPHRPISRAKITLAIVTWAIIVAGIILLQCCFDFFFGCIGAISCR